MWSRSHAVDCCRVWLLKGMHKLEVLRCDFLLLERSWRVIKKSGSWVFYKRRSIEVEGRCASAVDSNTSTTYFQSKLEVLCRAYSPSSGLKETSGDVRLQKEIDLNMERGLWYLSHRKRKVNLWAKTRQYFLGSRWRLEHKWDMPIILYEQKLVLQDSGLKPPLSHSSWDIATNKTDSQYTWIVASIRNREAFLIFF